MKLRGSRLAGATFALLMTLSVSACRRDVPPPPPPPPPPAAAQQFPQDHHSSSPQARVQAEARALASRMQHS